MGRSVSYPSGSHVAYSQWDAGWVHEDYDTGEELAEPHFDELLAQDDWDYLVDDFKEQVKKRYPSVWEIAPKWIDREDCAFLANNYCYFGMSEYCGVIAYWVVPRGDLDWAEEGRALHWFNQIEAGWSKLFSTMHRVGGFSDGTSVYQKVSPAISA